MAQCIAPIRLKNDDGSFRDCPCGKCGFCLQNRRKEWSYRIQKELRHSSSAYFLTLTYSDEKIPLFFDTDTETGEESCFPVLRKRDVQLFFKRLRKRQGTNGELKYYSVGEYGSRTMRPHYHVILFNLSPDLVSKIGEIWQNGHVDVGTVTTDSIDYVTKYVVNKYELKNYFVPPFAMISKGIGLKHLSDNYKKLKGRRVVRNDRGYKQVMPRYYRDKMNENAITKQIKAAKAKKAAEQLELFEIDRLKQVHSDSIAYLQERKDEANRRISRHAKKGDKL